MSRRPDLSECFELYREFTEMHLGVCPVDACFCFTIFLNFPGICENYSVTIKMSTKKKAMLPVVSRSFIVILLSLCIWRDISNRTLSSKFHTFIVIFLSR